VLDSSMGTPRIIVGIHADSQRNKVREENHILPFLRFRLFMGVVSLFTFFDSCFLLGGNTFQSEALIKLLPKRLFWF